MIIAYFVLYVLLGAAMLYLGYVVGSERCRERFEGYDPDESYMVHTEVPDITIEPVVTGSLLELIEHVVVSSG